MRIISILLFQIIILKIILFEYLLGRSVKKIADKDLFVQFYYNSLVIKMSVWIYFE